MNLEIFVMMAMLTVVDVVEAVVFKYEIFIIDFVAGKL
jgi:hypothetical protein